MKTIRQIWDRLTQKTKTVHVVESNEYWGTATATKWQREVPASATAREIYLLIIGAEEPSVTCNLCTYADDTYIRSSTFFGPHHKGVITEIWWGEEAEEKANGRYAELLAGGAKPTPQGW